MLGDMQQAIVKSQSQSTTKKPYRLCNHRSGKAFFVLIVFEIIVAVILQYRSQCLL